MTFTEQVLMHKTNWKYPELRDETIKQLRMKLARRINEAGYIPIGAGEVRPPRFLKNPPPEGIFRTDCSQEEADMVAIAMEQRGRRELSGVVA